MPKKTKYADVFEKEESEKKEEINEELPDGLVITPIVHYREDAFKKKDEPLEHKAEIVSEVFVWYFDESGNMNRVVNRWKGLKKGDAFYI
jgi:hypothetical protein